MIHLTGFGIVGSVLAWRLREAGLDFTWSDESSPYVAWKACTGSVLPTGEPLDQEGYAAWSRWAEHPPWGSPGIIEAGSYLYNHANPPEGGRFKQTILGPFRLAEIPSLHVNAQALVEMTRKMFERERRAAPPASGLALVTHGFSRLLSHTVWGWHALARIEVPWPLPWRPCLYLRHNRFRLTYAYPKPGTEYHYIGSDMIAQRVPHSLSIKKKLETWLKYFEMLAGRDVRVTIIPGTSVEGWRPTPKENLPLLLERSDGLWVRPLGHSGVRWSHSVADAVLSKIRKAA
jgi:hypothetical protein